MDRTNSAPKNAMANERKITRPDVGVELKTEILKQISSLMYFTAPISY
jgi:hypothetical protein